MRFHRSDRKSRGKSGRPPGARPLHRVPAGGAGAVAPSAAGDGGARLKAGPPDLPAAIGRASFAFRGYDVTNLGRSAEILGHRAYGPTTRRFLDAASALTSEVLGRTVDLADRVAAGESTGLQGFTEDVATIVAMELAQVALLEEFFGVRPADARQSFGYSIGEMAALISGGVFTLEQLLPVPLACAADCAELAENSTLGVLFSRGPALSLDAVKDLCTEISGEGNGLVGVSAYLSPNTALIHGEGETVHRLAAALPGPLPGAAALRLKTHKLPPLHTPIVWRRNIPNRAAAALYKIGGRLTVPDPKLISCVTGTASYTPGNARDTLIGWVDHPQLLWEAIDETLRGGVETVVHVGPAPNLIPATFQRLGKNIAAELERSYFGRIGREFGSRVNRHAWLARMLPARAALLRAPTVQHIILEDWLLERDEFPG